MKYLYFIFFSLLLISCSESSKKSKVLPQTVDEKVNILPYVIDVEGNIKNSHAIKLSSYAKELTYIQLETSNKCLLGENLKIRITDQYIFIKDNKALYQFDTSGKFIRQIGKVGRGPGEYEIVFDFTINPETKEILVIPKPSGNVLVYDIELGNFKRSFHYNSSSTVSFTMFPPNSLTFHVGNTPINVDPNLNNLLFTDFKGLNIDSIPSSNKRKQGNFIGDLISMYLNNNDLFYMTFFTDTLYKVSSDRKQTGYAIFNFGGYQMDYEAKVSPSNINKYNDQIYLSRLVESKHDFFLDFTCGLNNHSTLKGIYNKSKCELVFLQNIDEKEIGLLNDIDAGLSFWPMSSINDSTMLGYMNSFKIKEYYKNHPEISLMKPSFKNLVEKLTENDNPVLILARLIK